jgi:Zn-dependent peptidase ImmA (M78 family)
MNTDDVISAADELRAENYQIVPPIDVYEIARNNGLEVIEKVFPDDQADISGFVTAQDGIGKLYVNMLDNPTRRRFTVAHELGHWQLHREELRSNPQRSILFRIAIGRLNKDPIERDANIFAANLLVPLDLLGKYKKDNSNEQLAAKFGVSTEVIGYRLSLLEKTGNVQKEKETDK